MPLFGRGGGATANDATNGSARSGSRGPSQPRPGRPRPGHSSGGEATPGRVEEERPGQMVPRTARTDLDHVAGERARPLGDGLELSTTGDAAAEGGQTGAEHIGDQDDVHVSADRTQDRGGVTALAGGPHQLGVGVADLMAGQASLAKLRQDRLARQSIVDLTGTTCAPDRLRSKAHGRRGYRRPSSNALNP